MFVVCVRALLDVFLDGLFFVAFVHFLCVCVVSCIYDSSVFYVIAFFSRTCHFGVVVLRVLLNVVLCLTCCVAVFSIRLLWYD